jgi:hypothetical protein
MAEYAYEIERDGATVRSFTAAFRSDRRDGSRPGFAIRRTA